MSDETVRYTYYYLSFEMVIDSFIHVDILISRFD